jgi:hypothetical protein
MSISNKRAIPSLNSHQQAVLEAIRLRLGRSRRWVTAAVIRRGLGAQQAADQQVFLQPFDRQLRDAVAAAVAAQSGASTDTAAEGIGARAFVAALTEDECDMIKAMADAEARSSAWMAAQLVSRGLQDLGAEGGPGSAPMGKPPGPNPARAGAIAASASKAVVTEGEISKIVPGTVNSRPADEGIGNNAPHAITGQFAENIHLAMLLRWGKASYPRLAADSGKSASTLHRIKVCEGAAAIDTVAEIAGALGMEAWRLLAPQLGADVAKVTRIFSEDALRVAEAVDADADPQTRRARADAILKLLRGC